MNPPVTPIAGSTPGSLQGAYGSQTDLESISNNNNKTDAQKVGELTKEFEAMLFKQIIKGMQSSLGGASMLPTEGPSSVYGDMMMDSLAHSISRSSQLGLSETFQQQITNDQSIDSQEKEDI